MNKNETIHLQLFAEGEEGEVTEQPSAQQEPSGIIPAEEKQEAQHPLDAQFHQHFRALEQQAQVLQEAYPAFDLRQELRNPLFARLTSPGVGVSVEDAFFTVHRQELQKAAVQAAQRQMSRSIASGGRRPVENGLSGQASAVSAFDYRSASKEQREDLKRRIRQAAAEGRKVYPGR